MLKEGNGKERKQTQAQQMAGDLKSAQRTQLTAKEKEVIMLLLIDEVAKIQEITEKFKAEATPSRETLRAINKANLHLHGEIHVLAEEMDEEERELLYKMQEDANRFIIDAADHHKLGQGRFHINEKPIVASESNSSHIQKRLVSSESVPQFVESVRPEVREHLDSSGYNTNQFLQELYEKRWRSQNVDTMRESTPPSPPAPVVDITTTESQRPPAPAPPSEPSTKAEEAKPVQPAETAAPEVSRPEVMPTPPEPGKVAAEEKKGAVKRLLGAVMRKFNGGPTEAEMAEEQPTVKQPAVQGGAEEQPSGKLGAEEPHAGERMSLEPVGHAVTLLEESFPGFVFRELVPTSPAPKSVIEMERGELLKRLDGMEHVDLNPLSADELETLLAEGGDRAAAIIVGSKAAGKLSQETLRHVIFNGRSNYVKMRALRNNHVMLNLSEEDVEKVVSNQGRNLQSIVVLECVAGNVHAAGKLSTTTLSYLAHFADKKTDDGLPDRNADDFQVPLALARNKTAVSRLEMDDLVSLAQHHREEVRGEVAGNDVAVSRLIKQRKEYFVTLSMDSSEHVRWKLASNMVAMMELPINIVNQYANDPSILVQGAARANPEVARRLAIGV